MEPKLNKFWGIAGILIAIPVFLAAGTLVVEDATGMLLPDYKPPTQKPFEFKYGNNTFLWTNATRFDGFYSKNNRFLNNQNGSLDKVVVPCKFWLDSKLTNTWRREKSTIDTFITTCGLRIRGVFGGYMSGFPTQYAEIKDLGTLTGIHNHAIDVAFPIVREFWLQYSWSDTFGILTAYPQYFTVGLFPFSVGRGIALGSAYGVVPDNIGYDMDMCTDQYAPGFKFSGDVMHCGMLRYDLYGAVIWNQSWKYAWVNEAVLSQLYGKMYNPARDFGAINYIVAGRLQFMPLQFANRKITIEPYGVYDYEPAQKVTVPNDAKTSLKTIGCAGEAVIGQWEFGFDTAFNFGWQQVRGVDRNIISKQVTPDGTIQYFNTKVEAVSADDPTKVIGKALWTTVNQPIVNTKLRPAFESINTPLSQYNGTVYTEEALGTAPDQYYLRNLASRFKDPTIKTLKGSMIVWDMAYNFLSPDFKLAMEIGLATGDTNPNQDKVVAGDNQNQEDYKGFISLQETYSGNRVRSAYYMSGFGGAPRITYLPIDVFESIAEEQGVNIVNRFNNLLYVGFSGTIIWDGCLSQWKVNPNVLVYWSDIATRALRSLPPAIVEANVSDPDEEGGDEENDDPDEIDWLAEFFKDPNAAYSEQLTSKFLGIEVNCYIDGTFKNTNFSVFTVFGWFLPGTFYQDISGLPLSAAERSFLTANKTGTKAKQVPLIGSDPAFFIDLGVKYSF
jgi:hypothetical protein